MSDTFKGIITADGKKRTFAREGITPEYVSDKTLSVDGGFADAKATGDAVKSLKGDIADYKNNDFVKSYHIDSKLATKTEKILAEEEIGNYYNNGYVICTSANNAFKRCFINITKMDNGIISFPFENETSIYFASSEVDNVTENFVEHVDNTYYLDNPLFISCGAGVDENTIRFDIAKIKHNYSRTKFIYYCISKELFSLPVLTKEYGKKELQWLIVNLDNLSDELKEKIFKGSIKNKTVICWGDSLTRGATQSYNESYPKQLGDLLGTDYTVVNYGVGGESARTIAGRQGGLPFVVSPFTIPADTSSVEISLTSLDGNTIAPLKQEVGNEKGLNPISIDGVIGELSINNDNGKYYFKRSESGDVVNITHDTIVQTKAMRECVGFPVIIWVGANEGSYDTLDQLINYTDLMIKFANTNNFLIIGRCNSDKNHIQDYETKMLEKYGAKFINIRDYLVKFGLSELGMTPTEQDNKDISIGYIPSSLKTDTVHLITSGYGLVAKACYERGKILEYW